MSIMKLTFTWINLLIKEPSVSQTLWTTAQWISPRTRAPQAHLESIASPWDGKANSSDCKGRNAYSTHFWLVWFTVTLLSFKINLKHIVLAPKWAQWANKIQSRGSWQKDSIFKSCGNLCAILCTVKWRSKRYPQGWYWPHYTPPRSICHCKGHSFYTPKDQIFPKLLFCSTAVLFNGTQSKLVANSVSDSEFPSICLL